MTIPEQSTRHIMMMEPADFQANSQTKETNQYQQDNPADLRPVHEAALCEFRAFRDILVENGIIVTTVVGQAQCPDDVFCNNWVSSHAAGAHEGNRMILYPMLAENRRTERRPEIMKILNRHYEVALDISEAELEGRFLESTGSLGMDRINRKIYCALSPRTDQELAWQVAETLSYDITFFNTENHVGKPVYHTDVLMFIGSGYVGICLECITGADRERIAHELSQTHEVIELSMEQMRSFCGNALEVRGRQDKKMLVMSSAAQEALHEEQKAQILKYVTKIVHAPIPTIEKYGGGSARCMLLELY